MGGKEGAGLERDAGLTEFGKGEIADQRADLRPCTEMLWGRAAELGAVEAEAGATGPLHDGMLEADDVALGIPEARVRHPLGAEEGEVDLLRRCGLHRLIAEQDRLALEELATQHDRLGTGKGAERFEQGEIVGDDRETLGKMTPEFLCDREGRGARVEIDLHAGLHKGGSRAGDAALGLGAMAQTLAERGEGRVELPERASVGAGDPVLAFERGEIPASRRLGDPQLLAELADRQISPLQKELCQAGTPGFDDMSGNAHGPPSSLGYD